MTKDEKKQQRGKGEGQRAPEPRNDERGVQMSESREEAGDGEEGKLETRPTVGAGRSRPVRLGDAQPDLYEVTDHRKDFKLGKLPPKHDPRTLRLAKYLKDGGLPAGAREADWLKGVKDFGMLANDDIGDCTIASGLHLMQVASFNTDQPDFHPTDEQALEAYERICGYRPNDPESDGGGVLLDVLNAWRRDGIASKKIKAFAAINPANKAEVMAAIDIFGGIYTGLGLPLSSQTQKVWSVNKGRLGEPYSWGGHCVSFHRYTHTPRLECVTWGERQQATWSFFAKYCDEAYVVITDEWLDSHGRTPHNVDLEALLADLKLVTDAPPPPK